MDEKTLAEIEAALALEEISAEVKEVVPPPAVPISMGELSKRDEGGCVGFVQCDNPGRHVRRSARTEVLSDYSAHKKALAGDPEAQKWLKGHKAIFRGSGNRVRHRRNKSS